jgi:hypothetical protein
MGLWQDILLDRVVDDDALRAAIGCIFDVEPRSILVVEQITPELDAQTARVIVERFGSAGDFPLHVSIYLLDQSLIEQAGITPGTELVAALCRALNCSCLMSDASPSVHTWLRIDNAGTIEHVTLDPDALDRDEYRLAGRTSRGFVATKPKSKPARPA